MLQKTPKKTPKNSTYNIEEWVYILKLGKKPQKTPKKPQKNPTENS